MSEALSMLALGGAIGAAFGVLGFPIPAPPTIPGVLGVVGLSGGWILVSWLSRGGL